MLPAGDDDLARGLPLPLAKLWRRARNATSAAEAHHAACCLWEASLRLLASTAVVVYAERGEPDPALAETLTRLARPALGDWRRFVRELVPALADDPGFSAVDALLSDRGRADLPRAAELDASLGETLGARAGPRGRVDLGALLDRLVAYRNREIGHGAAGLRPAEFYARMGRALLEGAGEVLGRLDVLAGRRLVYVDSVGLQRSGDYLIGRHLLMGTDSRRLESLVRPASDAPGLPRPERVYLDAGGDGAPLCSLGPLLVYDPILDDVLFLNARRNRRRCEYLHYITGEHKDRDELDGERRALLVRALGGDVDGPTFELWAARSEAEEAPDSGRGEDAGRAEPPRRVGEFELLSELGRGAMGRVYRAWQPSLGRQVALKRVAHADDPRALARFRREIRALGRVDHPHLVKVFTSGLDDDPPHFTMELVEGATLAAVCDSLHARRESASDVDLDAWRACLSTAYEASRRSETPVGEAAPDPAAPGVRRGPGPANGAADRGYVRQVVELVRQVATAAAALHDAGVVHRDIKPGNVMVTPDGSQAVLMDLGLAQLADDVEGRLTRTRQFVGTLRYASPEQVLSAGGVDRRSDIYSLGATLWELLTLRPLFGATDATPTPELMQRIIGDDPDRVRKHHPGLPADLEAIVFKCLEKRPRDRYDTAADLAADLSRWLGGELVAAQPLTMRYVLGKFARRHRWALAAAAAASLVLGAAGFAEFRRIKRSRDDLDAVAREISESNAHLRDANSRLETALALAEDRRREATRHQEAAQRSAEAARRSAEKAAAFDNLLQVTLGQADPNKNRRARQITVEESLDLVAARLDSPEAPRPEIAGSIRLTLGRIYYSVGKYEKAAALFRKVVEAGRGAAGGDEAETLQAMNNLAVTLGDLGRPDEALPLQREVFERQRARLAPDHPATLTAEGNLSATLAKVGRVDEALEIQRRVEERATRALGPSHPVTLAALGNLAATLGDLGRLEEAEPLQRRVVEELRSARGPGHPSTLIAMGNLARTIEALGRVAEAESMQRDVLEALRQVLRPDHPSTLVAMGNLARMLDALGRPEEALPLKRDIVEALSRALGPHDRETLGMLGNLARSLDALGRTAEADLRLGQLAEGLSAVRGEAHPETLAVVNRLASLRLDARRGADAVPLFRRLVAACRQAPEAGGPDLAGALTGLGAALIEAGDPREAEPALLEALAICRRDLPAEDRATALAEGLHGLCLVRLGRLDEAGPILHRNLETIRSSAGFPATGVRQAMERMAAFYEAKGDAREAAAWRARGWDQIFPDDPFRR